MYNATLLACLLVVGQATAPTQQAPDPEIAAQVRALVRQLNDDELAKRNEAEAQLIALGHEILDLLPPITDRTPAEAKARLVRIREKLELARADAAVRASRVTLQGKMSLAKALAEIERQTGNRFTGFERHEAELDLDLADVPFWEATDRVLDDAELELNPYRGAEGLPLTARPEGQVARTGRAAYGGIFRIEPVRIDSVRDLRHPAVSGLRLAVQIAWEPRVAPISLAQPLAELRAFDENGDSIEVDGAPRTIEAGVVGGASAVEMRLPFELPERGVGRIASLKGTIVTTLPGRVATFSFDKLGTAKNVEQRQAGVTVTLEQVRKNGDLYQVRIGVVFDQAANALESHRGWILENPAYVIDAKGNRLEHFGIERTREGENEIGLSYVFDLPDGPEQCKFFYETPAAIIRSEIPYELKDIELP